MSEAGQARVADWPELLHERWMERAYPGQRRASESWVGSLLTRNGKSRALRIRMCGRPIVARRDGETSWVHAWCHDRFCYACAKSRSRRTRHDLEGVLARATLPGYFVTMTARRREGETLADTWSERQRAWELLRRRKSFSGIAGGVRRPERLLVELGELQLLQLVGRQPLALLQLPDESKRLRRRQI